MTHFYTAFNIRCTYLSSEPQWVPWEFIEKSIASPLPCYVPSCIDNLRAKAIITIVLKDVSACTSHQPRTIALQSQLPQAACFPRSCPLFKNAQCTRHPGRWDSFLFSALLHSFTTSISFDAHVSACNLVITKTVDPIRSLTFSRFFTPIFSKLL